MCNWKLVSQSVSQSAASARTCAECVHVSYSARRMNRTVQIMIGEMEPKNRGCFQIIWISKQSVEIIRLGLINWLWQEKKKKKQPDNTMGPEYEVVRKHAFATHHAPWHTIPAAILKRHLCLYTYLPSTAASPCVRTEQSMIRTVPWWEYGFATPGATSSPVVRSYKTACLQPPQINDFCLCATEPVCSTISM